MARPLSGIRIFDLTRLLPGPACSWYLQGLGAEVIRVEDPRGGDWMRAMPPFTDEGHGAWFQAMNAGKQSVSLDLRQPEERQRLHALLDQADVLIEGFRPGVMARLGLPPADLLIRHPRLVVASLSGFGQDGPLRDLPGHDLGYAGLTGALALSARHEALPDLPGVQLADLAGGALTAALAIVAALYERSRSGAGRWLDLSITDGTLALMAPQLAATALGSPPGPGEEPLTGALPVYGLYRCQCGGLIALAALEPAFQAALERGLLAVLGREVPLRRPALEQAFGERPREVWLRELSQACVTEVLEPEEVLLHPLHRARGMIVGEGRQARVRPPFPGAEAEVVRPAPRAGEHDTKWLPGRS